MAELLSTPYIISFQAEVKGTLKDSGDELARAVTATRPGTRVLEESSAGRPGLTWPIICVITGLLWFLSALGSVVGVLKGQDVTTETAPS